MPPCMNTTISIIQNLHHNFPKMRGRGVKDRFEFFKNSSNLVAGSFPYLGVTCPLALALLELESLLCLVVFKISKKLVPRDSKS